MLYPVPLEHKIPGIFREGGRIEAPGVKTLLGVEETGQQRERGGRDCKELQWQQGPVHCKCPLEAALNLLQKYQSPSHLVFCPPEHHPNSLLYNGPPHDVFPRDHGSNFPIQVSELPRVISPAADINDSSH